MSDPVLERRSIRKYTEQPVPDKLVETLLRAAMSAPSSGNQQPWHFVVIHDRAILDAVSSFHPYARMINKAPLAILVCGDESLEKSKGFWAEDCSAATENILIEAQELGLGSVWLGLHPREFRVRKMRELIPGMPEHVVPFALLPVGYPAELKRPSNRYDEARIHNDRW